MVSKHLLLPICLSFTLVKAMEQNNDQAPAGHAPPLPGAGPHEIINYINNQSHMWSLQTYHKNNEQTVENNPKIKKAYDIRFITLLIREKNYMCPACSKADSKESKCSGCISYELGCCISSTPDTKKLIYFSEQVWPNVNVKTFQDVFSSSYIQRLLQEKRSEKNTSPERSCCIS